MFSAGVCGKALAGWPKNSSAEIIGGFPPTHKAIQHRKKDFVEFVKFLFHGEVHIKEQVQMFLGVTVVRWYKQFCKVLDKEPTGKYETITNHPFISLILTAANNAACTEVDILIWNEELVSDFIGKNYTNLDFETLKDLHESGRGAVCDSRTIVSLTEETKLSIEHVAHEVRNVEKKINHLREDFTSFKKEIKNLMMG